MKKIIFRLKDGRTPASWQLPLGNVFLPKVINERGENADKLIHYMPGANSIWAEDYKGDKKPQEVWFENGILEVSANDVLLLEILKRHRFFNVHYEKFDEDANAETKILEFELRDKASELVNSSDDIRTKALAMALIGNETYNWSPVRCKAELKERAYNNPKTILDEAEKPNYENRYLIALSYLQNLIKDNETLTSVVWVDTEHTIIRLAVGESGIDKMTDFISVKSEESMMTLQRLGELTNKIKDEKILSSFVADSNFVNVEKEEKILSQEKEIEELKRQLALKTFVPETSDVSNDEKVEPPVTDNPESLEDSDDVSEEEAEKKKYIEGLREAYFKKHGNEVPKNMKNDTAWMLKKLQ